jgi:membrane protein YqaA with SNARE-associated domain
VRRYRIELKYLAIAIVVIGALFALEVLNLLAGLDTAVADFLTATEGLGAIGMFAAALISNCAILVQIPYTLPLLSAALSGADLGEMLLLGVAAGIGAGCGEVIKYTIADRVLARRPDLGRSPMYQRTARIARERPRLVGVLVFVWAASILPDDAVVLPLAMIRYGVRRIAAPLFIGKVLHNLFFAALFFWASDWAGSEVKRGVRVDFALSLMVVFVLLVLYQVEKARAGDRDGEARSDAEV